MKIINELIDVVVFFCCVFFMVIVLTVGICGAGEDVPTEVPPIPDEYQGGLKP